MMNRREPVLALAARARAAGWRLRRQPEVAERALEDGRLEDGRDALCLPVS